MPTLRREKNSGPLTDDEARGLDLAQQIELSLHGERAAACVLAGCWVLATVIVQAIEHEDTDPLEAVSAVTRQLFTCVDALRQSRALTKQ